VALSYRRKNKGFSLLELIISIAILAIGIIAVLETLSFSVRAGSISGDITRAAFIAEDKMQELEFKEKQNIMPTLLDSSADNQKDKFKWRSALIPEEGLVSDKTALYKLNFNIDWGGPGKERTINLNTYLRYEKK
jgi:prepilin-type N-terminal cleavage/methylation domain-containing protein